jgi:hypothetical protein
MVAGNILWEEVDAKYFLVQYFMKYTIVKIYATEIIVTHSDSTNTMNINAT